MTKRKRRQYTVEQKVALLKRHLIEKIPVATLCDEEKIQPSVFYQWQELLFGNAGRALERQQKEPETTRLGKEVALLKAKLARKDEVIAEISEEYVQLKKELGEA